MNQIAKVILLVVTLMAFQCALARDPKEQGENPRQMLLQLRRGLPSVNLLTDSRMAITNLSGHYSYPGPEFRKTDLGRSSESGNDLYLFPDGDYIYIEWADIMSPTIHDKGRWGIINGFLTLTSDGSLPKSPGPEEHVYLILSLTGVNESQIFLMGTGRKYTAFIDGAALGPKLRFLSDSLEMEKRITEPEGPVLKAKLMKKSWKPEWFE